MLAQLRLPELADLRSLIDFCYERRHGATDGDLVESLLGLLAWPMWEQRVAQDSSYHASQWDEIQLRYLQTVVVFGRVREDPRAWPAVVELMQREHRLPWDVAMDIRIDGSIIASAWCSFGLAFDLLDVEERLKSSDVKANSSTMQRNVGFQRLVFARAGVGLRQALWRVAERRKRIGQDEARAELQAVLQEAEFAVDIGRKWGAPDALLMRGLVRRAELFWALALIDAKNKNAVQEAYHEAEQTLKEADHFAGRFEEIDSIVWKTRIGLALVTGDSDELERSWEALIGDTTQLQRFPRWCLTARLVAEYAWEGMGADLDASALPATEEVDQLLLGRTQATWQGVLRRVREAGVKRARRHR
jgi:hypothetical protein